MIKKYLLYVCIVLKVLLASLVSLLIIPVAMQVIARYTGIIPVYLWTEELATFIFVWIVMIGSALAVWNKEHFDVKVFNNSNNPSLLLLQNIIVHVAIACFGLLFMWYGIDYLKFGYIQHSVMMNANLVVTHVTVPLTGFLWLIFSLYHAYDAIQQYQFTKKVRA